MLNYMNYLRYLTSLIEVKLWHLLAALIATMLFSSSATALYVNATHPVCPTCLVPESQVIKPEHKSPITFPQKQIRRSGMINEYDGRKF